MKTIKVGCFIPNKNDSTSLYRACGPLSQLSKDYNVQIDYLTGAAWSNLFHYDVIFMQRPYKPDHMGIAELVVRLNIPLWLDYDDYLFDVPKDNPAYPAYMNESARANMTRMLQLADLVTVTNNTLKELYSAPGLATNVHVVPNAYDFRFHHLIHENSGSNLITWRGSKTHDRDVQTYAEPISAFLRSNPDWEIEFIGELNCWTLIDSIDPKQVTVTPPMDPFVYMQYLKNLKPSIHIVPLYDNFFNRCKSNIAWIEATAAGAVALAPKWEDWALEGVMTYENQDTFLEALQLAAKHTEGLKNLHEKSYALVEEDFNLLKINQLRYDLLKQMVDF